jgi:hypothetical protein
MPRSGLVLAYLAPEAILPVTSIVAAVAGLLMAFGRRPVRLLSRLGRRALRRRRMARMAERAELRRHAGGPFRGPHRRLGAVAETEPPAEAACAQQSVSSGW